jgi:predicted transcriptional regulator
MANKEVVYETLDDGTQITQALVDKWVEQMHTAVDSGSAKYIKRRDLTNEEKELLKAQLNELSIE